jgi:hypothetical protein
MVMSMRKTSVAVVGFVMMTAFATAAPAAASSFSSTLAGGFRCHVDT